MSGQALEALRDAIADLDADVRSLEGEDAATLCALLDDLIRQRKRLQVIESILDGKAVSALFDRRNSQKLKRAELLLPTGRVAKPKKKSSCTKWPLAAQGLQDVARRWAGEAVLEDTGEQVNPVLAVRLVEEFLDVAHVDYLKVEALTDRKLDPDDYRKVESGGWQVKFEDAPFAEVEVAP